MDDFNENQVNFLKVIIVGQQSVGKTSLVNLYCYGQYNKIHRPTVGCDYSSKQVEYKSVQANLQLWDIAGNEKFYSVSKLYIRGAMGCLVLCDTLEKKSLDTALIWKKIVQDCYKEVEEELQIPIYLVQNKYDLVKDSKEEDLKDF